MSSNLSPPFEDWVRYCFTHGYDDFHGKSGDPDEVVEEREDHFIDMDNTVLTRYLTQLFESPEFIAEQYTDDQIARATTFIFSMQSSYFEGVQDKRVPPDLQVRCYRSVATLYLDLYDRVCGKRGTDPDTNLINSTNLDTAVWMIWDMDVIAQAVISHRKRPHLVKPAIDVLEIVLQRCRTSTCQISALHGISHIYEYHNNLDGDKTIARRLGKMIDVFLESREMPLWLRDYATDARVGAVR